MKVRSPQQKTPVESESERPNAPVSARRSLKIPWILRIVYCVLGSGLIGLLIVAGTLSPDPSGIGTHEQLGLPPCGIKFAFGVPCPSCGMTTSWSLAVKGRLIDSVQCNAGGFLMALFAAPAAIWLLSSGYWGRWVFLAAGSVRRIGFVFRHHCRCDDSMGDTRLLVLKIIHTARDRQMKKIATAILFSAMVISLTGCIGFLSNMMYMFNGLKIDAAYDGLEESRVAIVVVSDASSYGPDTLTALVGRAMGIRLSQNVKGITLVPQNVIENWKDTHGWDEVDFREIGKGVNADRVIALEIAAYSIHEGSTLYKGRSMVTTTVFDLESEGEVVFSQGPAEYLFPKSHARPVMSTTEQQFESVYLGKLVDNIARNFYQYDKADAVAEDATGIDFH